MRTHTHRGATENGLILHACVCGNWTQSIVNKPYSVQGLSPYSVEPLRCVSPVHLWSCHLHMHTRVFSCPTKKNMCDTVNYYVRGCVRQLGSAHTGSRVWEMFGFWYVRSFREEEPNKHSSVRAISSPPHGVCVCVYGMTLKYNLQIIICVECKRTWDVVAMGV